MVRMTTGGVLKSYRYNLMNSFIRDNKARETALTQRVFNSYAEAPADAAKAFRLRKSRMMTSSQLSICQDTYSKYQAGYQCLQSVDELIDTENPAMTTLKDTTLKSLNDPEGDARTQLSKVLDQLSDSIIQTMNQTYGDNFIFAGADGSNVPFTVEEVDGHKQLYYRGVPVDASVPDVMMGQDGETPLRVNANGEIDNDGDYLSADAKLVEVPQTVTAQGGGTLYVTENGDVTLDNSSGNSYLLADTPTLTEEEYQAAKDAGEPDSNFTSYTDAEGKGHFIRRSDIVSMTQDEYDSIVDSARLDANSGDPYIVKQGDTEYYIVNDKDSVITQEDYEKACKDVEKLDYLANEKRFVDIGLGFQEDENGKLIESSAFDAALSGLTFLGYGVDDDGDPKNIFSIVQRLTEIADSVPDGTDWDDETYDEYDRLVKKLEKASSNYKSEFTNMAAGTQKLSNNIELLKDNVYDLKEQYAAIEDVDMADAITSFIWAEYCYNAALKVGNSVLSQSLMDYLN